MNPLRKLSTLAMKVLGPAEVGQDATRVVDAQAAPSTTEPAGDREGDARLA